ncbi:MAG: hypothetical protein HQ592_18170 [Planctomycetes bacterium]|nr:hypothetical protein [Planctomycetota bacterium]
MGDPAVKQSESPKQEWAGAVMELRFLENVGGVDWGRMESSIAEAEQLASLRIEREEALQTGGEFRKHEKLLLAEKAMEQVNLFRRIVGSRIVARMAELGRNLDEEPKCRFSDEAIEWVFSRLPRWEISPGDAEMQAAVKRFIWLGEQRGASEGRGAV